VIGEGTVRHESELGWWEMTTGAPHVALRPFVREYIGWFEHMAQPVCRREPPSEIVPVIINFGAPIRVFASSDAANPEQWTDYGSFTTGPFDTFALVGSAGPSGGLQVNLTILGARMFLGLPLHVLTNRIVALEEVLGCAAPRLVAELYDAPTWDVRFAILDREIAARIARAHAPSREVLWAWRRLIATRGKVSIGTLVDEVDWSAKHLIDRFRDEIGLPPKTLARVLRFGSAVHMIKAGRGRLIDIANDCGYYDQAHFSRDVRAFAGVTPTELVESLLPDAGGFTADR
jgi:AraC-like DNA-binding protein